MQLQRFLFLFFSFSFFFFLFLFSSFLFFRISSSFFPSFSLTKTLKKVTMQQLREKIIELPTFKNTPTTTNWWEKEKNNQNIKLEEGMVCNFITNYLLSSFPLSPSPSSLPPLSSFSLPPLSLPSSFSLPPLFFLFPPPLSSLGRYVKGRI